MIAFKNDKVHVFFGGICEPNNSFSKNFELNPSKIYFKKIKQLHSDIIVETTDHKTDLLVDKITNGESASADLVSADAHYTSMSNVGLVISTADCMPIMVYCKQTERVAAIHAGWRGVQNKITEKLLNKLIITGSTKKEFQIWIGPHILQKSFDVDKDVYFQLAQSHYGLKTEEFSVFKNNKYYIDLQRIVTSQIQHVLKKMPDICYCHIDTKTNFEFYSYRRDQQCIERNQSFIYIKKSSLCG